MFDWTYKQSSNIVPPNARKEKPVNPLSLPTLPTWENLHPLMVHFPIVLLTIAGVPLLLSLFWTKQRTMLLFLTASLFAAGTISALLALSTGEEAEHAAKGMSKAAHKLAHDHEDMAELTRNIFIAVTVVAIALALAAKKFGTGSKAKFVIAGSVLATIGWGIGSLALANTGHLGALLVHEHGVHANLDNSISPSTSATSLTSTPAMPQSEGDKREDDH